MREAKASSVERDATQHGDEGGQRRVGRALPPVAIGEVAEESVPEGSQMDADLMGSAGLQTALDERRPRQALEHAKTRDGALPLPRQGYRHAHARALVARDGGVDDTARGPYLAMHEADVAAPHAAPGELGREGGIGEGGLGEDDQTRGALVQSMHDAPAPRPAD